jgi:Skp family chaperone for outer membrane proteins
VGIEKLLKDLKDYLDKGERKKKAHCERIDELLAKLEEKEAKLTRKLEKEKDSIKRKRLKTELKIVAVQRMKGAQRRDELNSKCD